MSLDPIPHRRILLAHSNYISGQGVRTIAVRVPDDASTVEFRILLRYNDHAPLRSKLSSAARRTPICAPRHSHRPAWRHIRCHNPDLRTPRVCRCSR